MEDVETYAVNVRDAGVLFYAKVIEDYEPPSESGDDSAQQLVLSEGELVAVTADHGADGWYGGYRLADPAHILVCPPPQLSCQSYRHSSDTESSCSAMGRAGSPRILSSKSS